MTNHKLRPETIDYYLSLIDKYQDMKYFTTDPIAVVRQCNSNTDIEIMGIVCSWLALGNRNQIYKTCSLTFEMMHGSPFNYLKSNDWAKYENDKRCYYRMLTFADFHNLMLSLKTIYSQYDTLENAILHQVAHYRTSYLESLIQLLKANGIPKNSLSACKRLCLFLRWMVRNNKNVDLGIWKQLDQTKLLIPLDVHVGRTARQQGLLNRSSSDMKAVIELTNICQTIIPSDPCAMDFALFGLGYTSANR